MLEARQCLELCWRETVDLSGHVGRVFDQSDKKERAYSAQGILKIVYRVMGMSQHHLLPNNSERGLQRRGPVLQESKVERE